MAGQPPRPNVGHRGHGPHEYPDTVNAPQHGLLVYWKVFTFHPKIIDKLGTIYITFISYTYYNWILRNG